MSVLKHSLKSFHIQANEVNSFMTGGRHHIETSPLIELSNTYLSCSNELSNIPYFM